VWVFSADVVVSGSELTELWRGIKVYYRENVPVTDDVKVIKLEENDVREIGAELDRSREYMVDATGMGDWAVGYLANN
jgi:hypothetical protein